MKAAAVRTGSGRRNRGVAVATGGSNRRVTIAESGVLAKGGNSFGFLRLAFAASVIASHTYLIGNLGKEPLFALSHGRITLGSVAVWGFFGLSGALVGLSAERAGTTTYLWHRARRILPAYWVCIVVSAFGFGALIARLQHLPLATLAEPANVSARTFVVNNAWLGYQQAPVGGVLSRLPYTFAINGSLWSLAYEAACYLILLAFVQGWIASHKRDLVIGAALALSVVLAFSAATHYAFPFATPVASLVQVPLLGPLDPALLFPLWSVFLTGTCLALWRDRIPLSPVLTAVAALACAISIPFGWFVPAGALAMPYALIGIGYYLPRGLRRGGRPQRLLLRRVPLRLSGRSGPRGRASQLVRRRVDVGDVSRDAPDRRRIVVRGRAVLSPVAEPAPRPARARFDRAGDAPARPGARPRRDRFRAVDRVTASVPTSRRAPVRLERDSAHSGTPTAEPTHAGS